jgi:hypothetical protein
MFRLEAFSGLSFQLKRGFATIKLDGPGEVFRFEIVDACLGEGRPGRGQKSQQWEKFDGVGHGC